MAKQTPILIKTFVSDAAVPRANLALIASGTNAGNVKAPAAAGDYKFIGVSNNPSDVKNQVDVVVAGIAQIESDGGGTIAAGAYVTIGNTTGQIKDAGTPAFGGATTLQIIGIALNSVAATAGLLVDVLIQPMLHKP